MYAGVWTSFSILSLKFKFVAMHFASKFIAVSTFGGAFLYVLVTFFFICSINIYIYEQETSVYVLHSDNQIENTTFVWRIFLFF